jgi:hypothetical protein
MPESFMSAPKAGYSTPMLNVASIEDSLRFYNLLGFETIATDGKDPILWARIECDGGALMLVRNEAPVSAPHQGIRLYLYTTDLEALRSYLKQNGIETTVPEFPHYMPKGESRVLDPDGNLLYLGHWGKEEHEEWMRELEAKRRSGK